MFYVSVIGLTLTVLIAILTRYMINRCKQDYQHPIIRAPHHMMHNWSYGMSRTFPFSVSGVLHAYNHAAADRNADLVPANLGPVYTVPTSTAISSNAYPLSWPQGGATRPSQLDMTQSPLHHGTLTRGPPGYEEAMGEAYTNAAFASGVRESRETPPPPYDSVVGQHTHVIRHT